MMHCIKIPFPHVLARHEQGAIHAAEGYARVSGKTRRCHCNIRTGCNELSNRHYGCDDGFLATCCFYWSSCETVIGTDAFQEADIIGITQPITKHNYQVNDVTDFPRIIKEAFHIASTGRPGPVVVDIPKNIATELFIPTDASM